VAASKWRLRLQPAKSRTNLSYRLAATATRTNRDYIFTPPRSCRNFSLDVRPVVRKDGVTELEALLL
jgi:hypothetical protein